MSDESSPIDFFDGMALILFALLLMGWVHFSWGWRIIIGYSIFKIIEGLYRHYNS